MAVLKNPANLLTNCLNFPQDNLGLAFSGDCWSFKSLSVDNKSDCGQSCSSKYLCRI